MIVLSVQLPRHIGGHYTTIGNIACILKLNNIER